MTPFPECPDLSRQLNLAMDRQTIFPRPFTYFDPKWGKAVDRDGRLDDGLNPVHVQNAHTSLGGLTVKIEDRPGEYGVFYRPKSKAFALSEQWVRPDARTRHRLRLLTAVDGFQVLQNEPVHSDLGAMAELSELPEHREVMDRISALHAEYVEMREAGGTARYPVCLQWSLDLDHGIRHHTAMGSHGLHVRMIDTAIWTDLLAMPVRLSDLDAPLPLQWRNENSRHRVRGLPDLSCGHEGTVTAVPSVREAFRALWDDLRAD